VSDIRGLARIARANDAYLLVDNSIMSPILSRPLDLGADLVVESATKCGAALGTNLRYPTKH
jgi:cystathionine beta-lyase